MVELSSRNSGITFPATPLGFRAHERLLELIRTAQSGCSSARQEILALTCPLKDALVARMAQQHRLSPEDVEDAQQEATFWVSEAIDHYDVAVGVSTGCCFTTFLFRVISFRLKNHVRSLCVQRRRFAQTPLCEPDLEHVERTTAIRLAKMPPSDPSEYVAWREMQQRIADAISRLGGMDGDLWALLSNGQSLHDTAETIGISYDQAKRARRRILSLLRFELGDHADDSPKQRSSERSR